MNACKRYRVLSNTKPLPSPNHLSRGGRADIRPATTFNTSAALFHINRWGVVNGKVKVLSTSAFFPACATHTGNYTHPHAHTHTDDPAVIPRTEDAS